MSIYSVIVAINVVICLLSLAVITKASFTEITPTGSHIHQLDSNLLGDGSISAIPSQLNPVSQMEVDGEKTTSGQMKEGTRIDDEERIDLRHNFTFRVNGRELALEAPSIGDRQYAMMARVGAKKVNRVGDYESPLDPESGMVESTDSEIPDTGVDLNSADISASGLVSPSSTASDLTANSRSSNQTSQAIGHKQREHLQPWKQKELQEEHQNNRIISDWPKSLVSLGRQRQSDFMVESGTGRHSTSESKHDARNQQPAPRFSALISSKSNDESAHSLNELAGRQSGQQQSWASSSFADGTSTTRPKSPINGRMRVTISSRLVQAIKTGANKENDAGASDSSIIGDNQMTLDGPKSKSRSKTTLLKDRSSSVRARSRFSDSHMTDDQLKSNSPRQSDNLESASTINGKYLEQTKASTRSEPKQSALGGGSSTTRNNDRSSGVLARKTSSPSNLFATEIIPNSLSNEYKTNSNNTLGTVQHATMILANNDHYKARKVNIGNHPKQTTNATNKSNIKQRDLTRIVHPLPESAQLSPKHEQPTTSITEHAPSSLGSFSSANAKSTNSTRNINPSASMAGLNHQWMASRSTESSELANQPGERLNGIVRTGPILLHPLSGHFTHASRSHLSALVPAALALLAQAQEDQQARATAARALRQQHQTIGTGSAAHYVTPALLNGVTITPTIRSVTPPMNQSQLLGVDHMIATANQMDVAHLGPQNQVAAAATTLGMSESNNYNSLADYAERPNSDNQGQYNFDSSLTYNAQTASNISGDEQGFPYSELSGDNVEPSMTRGILSSHQQNLVNTDSQLANSRSSLSDVYMRSDTKNTRDSPAPSFSQLRGSIDPFEEMSGLSANDYERDLADLDEEFRQTAQRRPTSDSYLSIPPERYEARRYNPRRPSYDYGANDYLTTAGSISNIIPRAYQRSLSPWPSGLPFSDSSDLWTDSASDYSPLSSFVNPTHFTTYRFRPRYQRLSPYSSAYLATSASEQQLQPGYNMIPSYPTNIPTDTIHLAISPLAAAAAAAASALAAADKSRHQSHAWLTLPRLTTSSITPSSTTSSASSQQTSALPATPTSAYLAPPRTGPYAFSPVPIYAFGPPRPAAAVASGPLATSASGAATSMLPYYHAAAPTLLAYRPTPAGLLPTNSLLTAASFAYPFRIPVTTMSRVPNPMFGMATSSTKPHNLALTRPYLTDLQFAETKYLKSNNNNHNSENSNKSNGFGRSSSTLTAMAKNLTKKVFGSASQHRPQHVAPPSNPSYESNSSMADQQSH